MRWLRVVAVLLVVLAAGAPAQDAPVAAEVPAFFVELVDLGPPLPDLALPPAPALPEDAAPVARHLEAGRRAHVRQGADVAAQRAALRERTKAVWLAAANSLRASTAYGTGLDRAKADSRTMLAAYDWYEQLARLQESEKRLHKFTEVYFETYLAAFRSLPDGERRALLVDLDARLGKLVELRRKTFEAIEERRARFWGNLIGTLLESAFEERPAEELATAMLVHLARERHYAWLVPETTLHLGVYGKLLEAHERSVEEELLEPRLRELQVRHPEWKPWDPEPAGAEAVRVRLVRLRARRAALVLYRKALQLEAGHRNKVSLALGFGEALRKRGEQAGLAWNKGVVTRESLRSAEPLFQGIALAGLAMKTLGDTASLGVASVKDSFLEVLKPAAGRIGVDLKTDVEKSLADYRRDVAEIDLRRKLLEQVTGRFTREECLAFVDFLAGDKMGAGRSLGRLPVNAPSAVSGLLFDAELAAATDGGLPAVFAPLARSHGERALLRLRGAQYETTANLDTAIRKLGAARGVAPEELDVMARREALELVLAPYDAATGRPLPLADRDSFLRYALWVPRTIWHLGRTVRTVGEFLKGNRSSQNRYLRALARQRESLDFLIADLERADFLLSRLRASSPRAYDEDHLGLMADNHAYVEAMRRIDGDRLRRAEIWSYGRHLADGQLTATGRRQQLALRRQRHLRDVGSKAHAARLKLAYLALTTDYAAAAVQVEEFQKLEIERRLALGLPTGVDLSAVADAFRKEALLDEVITIWEGLYQQALSDMAIKGASLALRRLAFGPMVAPAVEAGAAPAAYKFPWSHVGAQLWKAANPWAGKFALKTIQGAAEDAIRSGIAQFVVQHVSGLDEKSVEAVLDKLWSVTEDVRAEAGDRLYRRVADWELARREAKRQREEAEAAAEALDAHQRGAVDPLVDALARARRDGNDGEVQRLREAIDERLHSRERLQLEARALAAQGDGDGAAARLRAAQRELAAEADAMAAAVMQAQALARMTGGDADDPEQRARWASALDTSEYRQLLAGGLVRYDDLKRLVDPADPLQLHLRLGQGHLDVGLLRRAVGSALAHDPDRADDVLRVGLALDKIRRRTMRELADEFIQGQGLGDKVKRVLQTAPDPDDPESGGLLDDVGLVFEVDGYKAEQERIRNRFREFLKLKGYDDGDADPLVAHVDAMPARRARERESRPAAQDWPADEDLPPAPPRGPVRRLAEDERLAIERRQGFHRDHADGLHVFAQKHRAFVIMRDGNPDSVPFFNRPDLMAKPMGCKAKTAKVGPNLGLVVDPTHPVQARAWDDALAEARRTDPVRAKYLEHQRERALEAWREYGDGMRANGYAVNAASGVIEYTTTDAAGEPRTFRGIHGDYDLHGVYRQMDDGSVRKVGFGSGAPESNARHARFREQINDALRRVFGKDFVLHGGQDDWDKADKKADPPVTVFFPDGRAPLRLETADDMRRFYESELGIRWEYRDAAEDASVGGATFKTTVGNAWARNYLATRRAPLVGSADAAPQPLQQGDAPLLVLDAARHLGFLTDPRFTREAVRGLAHHEALGQLEEALARSDRVLRLFDAYLVGTPGGPARYEARLRRKDGYLAAVARDVEEVLKERAAFTETDLAMLRRLAAIQERRKHPTPWSVPGMGDNAQDRIENALALVDWMRTRAVDLVAATAPAWSARREGRSLQAAFDVARAAELQAGAGEAAFVRAPFDLAGAEPRALTPAEYRTLLGQGVRDTLARRQAVVARLGRIRRELLAQDDGPVTEEEAEAMERRVAEALEDATGAPLPSAASEWRRYAGLVGVSVVEEDDE